METGTLIEEKKINVELKTPQIINKKEKHSDSF
jgi:hypothetical protein